MECFLFLITDDRDFRPQTCTNGLVFKECKHIKNIFEDVCFTKNSFHITLSMFYSHKNDDRILTFISCVASEETSQKQDKIDTPNTQIQS